MEYYERNVDKLAIEVVGGVISLFLGDCWVAVCRWTFCARGWGMRVGWAQDLWILFAPCAGQKFSGGTDTAVKPFSCRGAVTERSGTWRTGERNVRDHLGGGLWALFASSWVFVVCVLQMVVVFVYVEAEMFQCV